MVEHELSSRIRQRSRAAGIFVGLSMALTIIIALTGFIWLYVRLGPYLNDFIPQATVTVTPTTVAESEATPTPTAAGLAGNLVPTSTPAPTPTPVWQPTHRIAEGSPVNFRAGPGTDNPIVQVLEPGTPLMFLGEQQEVAGAVWLHLELEDGTDGWVRTVDLERLQPQ